MIQLDKIKIVSNIKNIDITNSRAFNVVSKNDITNSYKYTSQSPYLVYVEANVLNNELIIEFTGKILGDNYPNLINKNNIVQCLENINNLNICHLNIDEIINDSQVVKIDITKDVECPTPCKELTQQIQANIANFKKYRTTSIKDNFIIEKNTRTKSYKSRLSIYDKYKELQRAENKDFLSMIKEKNYLLDYYKNKVRFEMNCNSKEQIRKALKIYDLTITNVLNSGSSPIWEFLDKVIADNTASISEKSNLKDIIRTAFLQVNDYDIEKVEAIVRNSCASTTNIAKTMKPFRELLNKIQNTNSANLKTALKALLLEFTIALFVIV